MLRMLEAYGMKKKLYKVEQYLEEYLHFAEPYLSESALYTLHAGGKRVRPTMVIMTAAVFDKEEEAIPMAAAMELIHMSSLIHDDIVDGADTRRNQPTLNVAYSKRYALHTGDYILTKAMEIVKDQPQSQRLLKIMADLSIDMCLGEIEQLHSEYDIHQTMTDYYYRIDRKTALLMATSCQVGAIISDASSELVDRFYQIGYNLGMAFQIKDDILDMTTDRKKMGKPVGEDLARGIMTMPTILVLQKDFPEKQRLIQMILDHFPNGQDDVHWALNIIKKYNGLEEAKRYSADYVTKAKEEIKRLPVHPVNKGWLDNADYIIERAF